MFKNEIFIKLISNLIFPKEKRIEFKKNKLNELVDEKNKKTKWGASYSVFDGEELLEASIKSIRKSVNYINVVYQMQSWYGEPASENLLLLLNDMKKRGLIDELIEYKNNPSLSAPYQENIKRNLGLKYAKKAGVNYLILMDTDEFYKSEEIDILKKDIIKQNITNSYCPIINYGTKPTLQIKTLGEYAVPLFSKINFFSRIKNFKGICLCDPNRNIFHYKPFYKPYFYCNIQMHHMSQVRRNLEKKYRNSLVNTYVQDAKNLANVHINSEDYISVDNIFNINI